MSSTRRPAAVALLALVTVALLIISCGGPVASSAPPISATDTPTSAAVASRPPDPAGPPACPASTSPDPASARGWWADRVFYEVFVRSFADSDGDGIGDLQGLIGRLDALNDGDPSTTEDLGVTALWLMPIDASPSYHGYDVTDYRTVEPDYGTNADFAALMTAAHARGIDVIVDLVLNHSSVEHPWFRDARTRGSEHDDWYVWADAYPGVSGPGGRPVWHQDGDRWYYGYFWEGMPDLNLANPAVTAEMDAVARFWVDEMGADGFRLDAARHLLEDGSSLENTPATFDWLRGFRARLHATSPSSLVLGEVWDATSVASRYVREGALDLTFDFGLASQLLQAVNRGDAGSLRIIQSEVLDAYPDGGYAAFLSNHDQDRSFDVLNRDLARAKQAATLLLTNPGVPFIYYGEELGLRGRKPDERIRTPMPWTGEAPGYGFTSSEPWQPMAEDVAAANVARQTVDPDSLLSRYRTLIALRGLHPALGPSGSLVPVDASDRAVYAVLRHDPKSGEVVLIASNLSDAPVAGIQLSLDDGPLCGSPATVGLLGSTATTPPLVVTAAGGLDAWTIGDLGPHEDVILQLAP